MVLTKNAFGMILSVIAEDVYLTVHLAILFVIS